MARTLASSRASSSKTEGAPPVVPLEKLFTLFTEDLNMDTEKYAFAAQSEAWEPQSGLTKREYFALHIMTGMLAGSNPQFRLPLGDLADEACQAADYLLEHLSRRK